MKKEAKDDRSIIVPNNFSEFTVSQIYIDFLESVLDYCKELF